MGKKEDYDNEEQLKYVLEELRALCDGIDEPIYVSDPETYEILFANKKLKELFGEKISGRKCYKVFQNLNNPCPFCTNKYIFGENLGSTHTWEFQNRKNKRWYRCIDKAIEWPWGKYARLEMAIDITEQKIMEEELKAEKEKFQTLFNLMADPVVIVDSRGKFLETTDRVKEITGYEKEELLGKNFLKTNIVTARSKAILLKNLAKRMMGMHVAPYEVEVVTKDGEKLPYEVNATKIQYEGKPADIVVFRDLRARKKLQEALVESEEKYRKQFEEAMDAILVADAETGIIIDCNRAASELVGRAKSELVGNQQRILHPPEKIEGEFSSTFKQHLKEKEGQVLETQVITKKGEIKDVAIKANVFELEGKKLIQGIFRDITERKRMEEKLRESEERFRNLYENIPDSLSVFVGREGHLLEYNKAFKKRTGYTDEELKDKKFLDFVHPEDRAMIIEKYRTTYPEEELPLVFELREINKKGEDLLTEVGVSTYKKKGRVIGIEVIQRDITKRKEMEKERKYFEERLSALNKHGQSLNMADDIEKVLTLTLDAMVKTLGFEFADVFLVEGKMLRLVAHRGLSKVLVLNLPLDGPRGVVVKAARLSKPVFVPDVRKERTYVETGVENMLSELAVPVKIRNKVLGVLNVESERLAAFDEKDRELLETLASHAAIAISDLKRQDKLSTLNVYGRSLNRAESMEEIYALTLKAMEKTLGFEYASILIRERKMLRLVSQRGYSNQLSLNMPLDGEKGVTVKAAITCKPVLVPDIRKEKAYVLGKPDMLSELAVPVKVGNEVLGVLNVESERLAAFDEKDRELLETLASHAAIAMSNLKKQKQLKKLSNKMKHLMKSTTEIMHVKDMQERLNVIVKTIRKFGWRRAVISLRDENLEGNDLVTAGLTNEEIKLLVERKAPGHVWRERLGPKFERFKIGEFYYLPWMDPWIREYVHGVPPEVPSEEATTYTGVPSRLPPEEMVDWHPQDMLYAPLRTPEGRIVGILSMDDPVDGRKPTRKSLAPLELFLHQAAIVIENVRLIESLRGARKQLEAYAGQLEQKVEERTRELERSQEQLFKAQRLAVIGELAGMVGHDLRNPLTGIAGAAYYVKKRLGSKIDRKTKEMLELVENNIVYSNKIINDLLDYSREIKLDLTVSKPRSIVKESLSLVKIPKNVQVIDLTEDMPKIKVDVGKMKRAFVNIIKNSVDAMPRGGTLTIKTERLNGNLEFVFSDTGVGMSKKTMEKLWTPLFTTKAKGMGFGLAICKRTIETHEGSISVKSARGKGTTVTITIPTKPKTEGGEKIWVKPPESWLLTTTEA